MLLIVKGILGIVIAEGQTQVKPWDKAMQNYPNEYLESACHVIQPPRGNRVVEMVCCFS